MFCLKDDYYYKIFKHMKGHMKRDAVHEYQGIHTGSRASQRPVGLPWAPFWAHPSPSP